MRRDSPFRLETSAAVKIGDYTQDDAGWFGSGLENQRRDSSRGVRFLRPAPQAKVQKAVTSTANRNIGSTPITGSDFRTAQSAGLSVFDLLRLLNMAKSSSAKYGYFEQELCVASSSLAPTTIVG